MTSKQQTPRIIKTFKEFAQLYMPDYTKAQITATASQPEGTSLMSELLQNIKADFKNTR